MALYFTHEELSYLAKKFGYKHLEGVDLIKFKDKVCEASLLDKGYILPYGNSYELSNDVRFLLSSWSDIRYTLVRDQFISDEHAFALLASEERIISYSFHEGNIQASLCDFSPEVMDKLMTDYLDVQECDTQTLGFNVTFAGEEYLSLFGGKMTSEQIAGKCGISVQNVDLIKKTLSDENSTSFIVQDVAEDIGCMGTFVRYADGYIMIKHIVPNNDPDAQKVVIVKGSAQDIIDSVYIL